MKVIGRKSEVRLLNRALASQKSELIVVYGRRRIGKTFLIREHYKEDIIFEVTGLSEGSIKDHLMNFLEQLNLPQEELDSTNTWMKAFGHLASFINKKRSKKKKVLFIDEFPWIATQRSKFLPAFEHFWNTYCTRRDDLVVVICGSAASYMVKKIIRNKKGLHNRISYKIRLEPFTLNETRCFLEHRGISYTNYDIIQIYMYIGGVPHYLEKLEKGKSVAQNIDQLCFHKNGSLFSEFNELYSSLFDDSGRHLVIINTLAMVNKGLTRSEIATKGKLSSGGDLTLKLQELEESGFITGTKFLHNKTKLTVYRLTDEYSKFYLKYINAYQSKAEGTWLKLSQKQSFKSWSGFTFEALCLKHIPQIKKGLGIEVVYSSSSAWFNANAQVDLLIDRDDNIINLCEMKFYNKPYAITSSDYTNLKNKLIEFRESSQTTKNIYSTFISTYGLKKNKYSLEIIQNDLDMDVLFLDL